MEKLKEAMKSLKTIDEERRRVEVLLSGEPEYEDKLFPLLTQIYESVGELQTIVAIKIKGGKDNEKN